MGRIHSKIAANGAAVPAVKVSRKSLSQLASYGGLTQLNFCPFFQLVLQVGRVCEAKLILSQNVHLVARIGPMCGLS